ncbi:class C beta-lactamase [Metallibacterium sp.]|uniref:class C beta-lactamase n=1 Tax=Metallibacterium sp. TaxID=2940281 RepID=UPI0026310A8C|nr:class C beta-lactamase [Metallibacterium sp.]
MALAALRVLAATALLAAVIPAHASDCRPMQFRRTVNGTVQPLMRQYGIPGMAVGLIAGGHSCVLDYGVASLATGRPVDRDTLFELGSVSKTLTATLVAWAGVDGKLTLTDPVDKYLPSLRGTPFGSISLLDLGTYTPGGLPLQVPDDVGDSQQLMRYLESWHPAYPPGTYRTYNNIGIGMLGVIAGKALGTVFTVAMQRRLLPALGMAHTYIEVPPTAMKDYAQGYTMAGTPIRLAPGVLAAEAYGARSTAADMLRFIETNLQMRPVDASVRKAIAQTHVGYFHAGVMTQDLIWEQVAYPAQRSVLLDANASAMIFKPTPVTRITPPMPPAKNVWINKTGSTNGFAAYVAFIPARRAGIVILANRNLPNGVLVTAAYRILTGIH